MNELQKITYDFKDALNEYFEKNILDAKASVWEKGDKIRVYVNGRDFGVQGKKIKQNIYFYFDDTSASFADAQYSVYTEDKGHTQPYKWLKQRTEATQKACANAVQLLVEHKGLAHAHVEG